MRLAFQIFMRKRWRISFKKYLLGLRCITFCEAITTHVVILHADRKYEYQVNFTVAIAICLQFFRVRNLSPPNVEALIKKNILPLRPGRNDLAKSKPGQQ